MKLMRKREIVWLALLGLAALLTLALRYLPYLPGDASSARFIQSLLPESKEWTKWLSSTATMPFFLALIGITIIISFGVSGWRAVVASVLSFAGLLLLGKGLGQIVFQPRPSPELIQVIGSLPGSAFPSIFALNYASTIGFIAVLVVIKTAGRIRWISVLTCSALLVLGWIARIALGAHWPSDVLISYLIGFLWVTLLLRFV